MNLDRRVKELELKVAELERLLARATMREAQIGGRWSGMKRGLLGGDLTDVSTASVTLTVWNETTNQWDVTLDSIDPVYPGIPIDGTISSGKVVWIIKVLAKWFVILAEC